jgi:hypothetical protein
MSWDLGEMKLKVKKVMHKKNKKKKAVHKKITDEMRKEKSVKTLYTSFTLFREFSLATSSIFLFQNTFNNSFGMTMTEMNPSQNNLHSINN